MLTKEGRRPSCQLRLRTAKLSTGVMLATEMLSSELNLGDKVLLLGGRVRTYTGSLSDQKLNLAQASCVEWDVRMVGVLRRTTGVLLYAWARIT